MEAGVCTTRLHAVFGLAGFQQLVAGGLVNELSVATD